VVIYTYNLSTGEAMAGGLCIPGQRGLHSEILTQNENKTIKIFKMSKSLELKIKDTTVK
jgi:hypothetical protein